ncbi:MAG TPA: transglutaminase domain-containing protein [Blastocatellia bacterium]|nr:transglutaminase domain-containing protein [Blastocatellia bacterium]
MSRTRLRLLLVCSLVQLLSVVNVLGQTAEQQLRDAEWKNHKLPAVEFARYVDLDKVLLFRVPASWQQAGPLRFKGPHDSELQVLIERIPDGAPLKSLTNGILHNLRDLPGGADALTVRRTEISALEAREFLFNLADAQGQMTRRLIWSTVSGPHAVSFVFIQRESEATETEPYFKAIVESAVIFESDAHYEIFEKLRAAAIKEPRPARMDEVRSLVAVAKGFDAEARGKAVVALASIFDSAPDSAIELLIDRRPLVRAAAVEAVARSSNRLLDGFLLQALADVSSDVALRAARALAKREDAVKLLREDSANWEGLQIERVMRAMALLDDRARSQIAEELLKRWAGPRVKPNAGRTRPVPPPPPPPAVREPSRKDKPGQKTGPPPEKFRVAAGGIPGGLSVTVPKDVTIWPVGLFDSPGNDEYVVLGMLPDLEPLASALPATKALESGAAAVALALRIALESRTKLPVDSLIKLLSSANNRLAKLAALNLAVSASAADIPRLETFSKTIFTVSASKPGDLGHERSLSEDLAITAKKIRWRERLASAASTASRDSIFNEGLEDSDLADFAWPYVRDLVEGPGPKLARPLRATSQAADRATSPNPPRIVSSLGENLLPDNVKLYAAIPDAQAFVDKLTGSLSSIQLESARTQANLLLMMKAIEVQVAKVFDAPVESSILEASGVKQHSPIVVASWTAAGAPRGLRAAERKAVIVRVVDRDRFEHLIATYQRELGHFDMLPEYVSAGARFISMLPALLPFAAQAVGGEKAPSQERPGMSYHLMSSESCNGYPVTVIERRQVEAEGVLNRDTVYLTYIGDAAVMAPDWFSLRDCLLRLEGKSETLAKNADFKRAVAGGGDVIYLSDPLALFGGSKKGDRLRVGEMGALKITKPGWESSFELAVSDQGWQKPLAFRPSELTAPATLLPRSTIAYLFVKLEFAQAWRSFGRDMFGPETVKQFESLWALDFEREVLPELGPELGAGLLGLPSLKGAGFSAPWVLFVQTKSDKLSKAFADGKLLRDAAAARAAKVKIGTGEYWFAVKNGFLIIADSEASIDKLNSGEHLSSARDFERASKSIPGEVIAFGGTNIQAAADSIKIDNNDPLVAQGMTTLLSLARAFHSQNFSATVNDRGFAGRMSVSLDRDGRFSLSDLAGLSKEFQFAAAEIEARGAPIADQKRVDSLTLRITSKAQGAIDRIKEDISTTAQVTDKRSNGELLVTISPRRPALSKKIQLPVTAVEFEPFVKAAGGISSRDPNVIARAKEIAADDRDAWSVARKLSDWTFKNLKWKRVDNADAAQTLATREADCLEFSQLFVAMARALGLPARIVTGLAHTGGSFGGHAWVEVWVGEWVELDPTWGTDFVDATHIKTVSSELGAYAALNLIGIEVVEARHAAAAFQKDPRALAEALCKEFNGEDQDVLAVALEPRVLVDALMGDGSWEDMTAAERDRVYSSHRRISADLQTWFDDKYKFGAAARVLNLRQQPDGAEAILAPPGFSKSLVTVRLVHKDEEWFVREVKYDDLNFSLIDETMRPTLSVLQARRKNAQAPPARDSAQLRILQARQKDLKQALKIAEQALKDDPTNQTLRYLKAICLQEAAEEEDTHSIEESVRLLTALADEPPGFAPAILHLGEHYAGVDEDDPEQKAKQDKAIEVLQRYAAMVPDDPRPHETLATVYEARNDATRAEAEHRAVVELDPFNPSNYADLARFLVTKLRYKEALAAIDQSKGRGASKDEAFSHLILGGYGQPGSAERAEGLAAAAPERLAASFRANLNLASVRINDGRAAEALPLLKRAAELDPKNAEPHNSMAEAYRKLHNWPAALRSADQAIKLDDKGGEAQFHRACALAQLHRTTEAIAALRKAVELDDELMFTDDLAEEQDLKPLAALAAFKKLVEETKRSEQEPPAPQKKDNDN